jgi:two-component system, NtrC family, response regulator PilR
LNKADKPHCGRILVIDDEPDLLTLYELALLREGHEVTTADSVAQAQAQLIAGQFDVVVTDMRLPDGQGLEIIAWLAEQCRAEKSIVITAYGSAESAVQALKLGAFDYLTKPVDLPRFRSVVRQAMQGLHTSLPSVGRLREDSRPGGSQPNVTGRLVGSSRLMRELRARTVKVAVSMAPVMLQGESGTGKEVLARIIHDCSQRAAGPFVAVNCSAIPETLLEAEFFGVRKGAYTGAQADRDGFFQVASGGTLFLDEIGDLPMSMQAKLLRAIQERMIRPLGSAQECPVDVRIVAATHRSLDDEVAQGRFRQDLYYRLNVIELKIPPLRDRKEDLPELAQMLLARIVHASGRPDVPQLSDKDLAMLASHEFPGNVRELENLLHRAWALSEDGEFPLLEALGKLPDSAAQALLPQEQEVPSDLEGYLDAHERRILLKVLQDTDYNRTAAAQRLGITLRQIRYRMGRLGIEVPVGRGFAETRSSTR